jgi:hypothetical protein
VKFVTRITLLVLLAVGGYFLVSWWVPRRAAKRDLAGIEARLDAIERNMAILVDRVQGGRTPEPDAVDERIERLLNGIETLAATVDQKADK